MNFLTSAFFFLIIFFFISLFNISFNDVLSNARYLALNVCTTVNNEF